MYAPTTRKALGSALAAAFLAGPWEQAGLTARAQAALRPRPRWIRRIVAEVLEYHHRPPLDRPRELAAFVEVLLERLRSPGAPAPPRIVHVPVFATEMGRRRFPVPVLDSPGDLAVLLDLATGTLGWLADARGLERRVADERLRRYRYVLVARRGGGPPRVLEAPKPRLKAIQRRLLREILESIPPHDAAHGFRRGHSARTHAAAHTGRRVVIRLDLEDFFASVGAGRVFGILRSAGYPEGVAHALTALTTNTVPFEVTDALAHHRLRRRLASPHLPQGAPTSPVLANLCAFSLDRRLSGLAASLGAHYTRYADDLAFSGGAGVLRRAEALRAGAAAIARDEGFRVNEAKSQLMSRAGRQRLGGVVVNAHPNVAREEYDALKAILRNAALRGPEGENRAGHPDFRAHLLGRVAWVASLNPARGERLRERFDAIDWEG